MRRPEARGDPFGWLLHLLEAAVLVGALLSKRPVRRPPSGVDPVDLEEGYEHDDVHPAVVLTAGVALIVIMGIVLVAITVFEVRETRLPPSVSRPQDLIQGLQAAPAPTPPAPQLEAQSGQAFRAYRAAEQRTLSEYRWIDRQAGVVAIPVERAMDVLAEQGLPVAPTSSVAPRDAGKTSPSIASSGRAAEAHP